MVTGDKRSFLTKSESETGKKNTDDVLGAEMNNGGEKGDLNWKLLVSRR